MVIYLYRQKKNTEKLNKIPKKLLEYNGSVSKNSKHILEIFIKYPSSDKFSER